jgi:signal transduction histidine kinase
MLSRLKPKHTFALAISLVLVSGLLAGFTIFQLSASEKWVRHTYRALVDVGRIQSNLAKADHVRRIVLETPGNNFDKDFESARQQLIADMDDLQQLTADNPEQQANCIELRNSVNTRIELLQQSMQAGGSVDSESQRAISDTIVRKAFETSEISDRMELIEQRLLERRRSIASGLYIAIVVILILAFALSLFLFRMYYRILSAELNERKVAEENAQSLSTALMRVQDEERRKFSRELHDSLGQILVGAKMVAVEVAKAIPGNPAVAELQTILDEALKETRTLSHLLHPPLLDEIGFVSAARWYTESYSERTAIPVDFQCPESLPEIPKNLELVMFRVMQESLTNAHKHSKGTQTTVRVSVRGGSITLDVQDNGIGIPSEKLDSFRAQGVGVGVGLAGMKQRVREQGGSLEISSTRDLGTSVSVTFNLGSPAPMAKHAAASSEAV